MHELTIQSPYDATHLLSLPLDNISAIKNRIESAWNLYQERSNWLSPHIRLEVLRRLYSVLADEVEDLARLIALECGKPLTDAKVEVKRALDGVQLAMSELRHLEGKQVAMGLTPDSENRLAMTMYEPLGVVVALSAFNHPLNLAIHQVIPAIAAGCPVIIKPSPQSPLSAWRLCEHLQDIFDDMELDSAWVQFCLCDNALVDALICDDRVAGVNFIGSHIVGWELRKKLHAGTRITLEHGGAAPVIIAADADIDLLVPMLTKAAFYHAGQVCVSTQRVFAHDDIMAELSEKLVYAASQQIVGNPLHEITTIGPMINEESCDRVSKWVQEAQLGGANLLHGGDKIAANCYRPTILYNPHDDAKVSTQEIFGPVMCLYNYNDRKDAILRANSVPFAFQASVFTKDIDIALNTVQQLDATGVMVNDHTAFRTDWMPFGGGGKAGLGTGGIGYTIRDMSREKLVVIKHKTPS